MSAMMHCFDTGMEKMPQMTLKGHGSQCITGRKGVGVLFYKFDCIRPTCDAVATHVSCKLHCSGMLNRVYGMMADGNCFAVTVTVSPCRTILNVSENSHRLM